MAKQSLSQLTPSVKSGMPIHFEFLNNDTPVVLSTDVALHFQRRHSHILRDIDRLRSLLPKSFFAPNFGLIEREVSVGFGSRKNPAYLLTRDAFTLLVMGMTGKAAIMWKLKYIEAFNALETAALESHAELAREAGYQQGLDAGRAAAAPVVQAERQQAAARVWSLGPAKKRRLRSAVRYRKLGLGIAAIARLLGVNNQEISFLLKAAQDLGLLPQGKPVREQQACLPGVTL